MQLIYKDGQCVRITLQMLLENDLTHNTMQLKDYYEQVKTKKVLGKNVLRQNLLILDQKYILI